MPPWLPVIVYRGHAPLSMTVQKFSDAQTAGAGELQQPHLPEIMVMYLKGQIHFAGNIMLDWSTSSLSVMIKYFKFVW